MHSARSRLGWFMVACLTLAAGCGPDGGGGGGGTGGSGSGGEAGSAGGQSAPAILGETVEISGPGVDLVGNPIMAANAGGFAVSWINRDLGYLEGQGQIIPPDGAPGSAFIVGEGAGAIRSSEDGNSFGAGLVVDGGPFEDGSLRFRELQPGGGGEGYTLTDYVHDPYSLDVVMRGGKWYLVTCEMVDIERVLTIASDLTSANQNSLDPLTLEPLPMPADAQCESVSLARNGDDVWVAYSAHVSGDGEALFLQRVLPAASEPVRITEPGTDPSSPHLFANEGGLLVAHWQGADERYAIRAFGADGAASGAAVLLQTDQQPGAAFDATMVEDRIVVGWLSTKGAHVQSFELDGAPASSALEIGPPAFYDTDRPAIGASGDVVGVAHYGEPDGDLYAHVYFTRVGGL